MSTEIDTFNYWFVAPYNGRVVVRNPPSWNRPLSPDDALLLAAWLVVSVELAQLPPFSSAAPTSEARAAVLERLAQVVRAIENA